MDKNNIVSTYPHPVITQTFILFFSNIPFYVIIVLVANYFKLTRLKLSISDDVKFPSKLERNQLFSDLAAYFRHKFPSC